MNMKRVYAVLGAGLLGLGLGGCPKEKPVWEDYNNMDGRTWEYRLVDEDLDGTADFITDIERKNIIWIVNGYEPKPVYYTWHAKEMTPEMQKLVSEIRRLQQVFEYEAKMVSYQSDVERIED